MSAACPPNSLTNDFIPPRASKEQEAILEDQVAQRHGQQRFTRAKSDHQNFFCGLFWVNSLVLMFGTWKSLELSCRYHCCCSSLVVEFIKSVGALPQCCQLYSTCGFILVLPSTLVCIFREVGHVPHDPSLSMNQSSSQVSPSVSAWHFLICLVVRCYLDWSSKERSQQIKNKNSIGDCEQDFDDLGFTTLGSKRLETWPILPTNYKLQIQVLILRRVFVETLNKLQYNTDVNHLKADRS